MLIYVSANLRLKFLGRAVQAGLCTSAARRSHGPDGAAVCQMSGGGRSRRTIEQRDAAAGSRPAAHFAARTEPPALYCAGESDILFSEVLEKKLIFFLKFENFGNQKISFFSFTNLIQNVCDNFFCYQNSFNIFGNFLEFSQLVLKI